jgi:hypothetical protein
VNETPREDPDVTAAEREAAAERRRRRDRVFGAVLADTTEDERAPGDDQPGDGTREEWLRRNVPPHHG